MADLRFIIIAVPPPGTAAEIQALREPLCRKYGALWALSYPPHVTLRTGAVVPEEKAGEFCDRFAATLAGVGAFAMRAGPARHGRMSYEGEEHFFLYLPVMLDQPLAELNRRLLSYTAYRKSVCTEFKPHLTLLWGDLPKAEESTLAAKADAGTPPFGTAWAWRCATVSLYCKKDGSWVPYRDFKLV